MTFQFTHPGRGATGEPAHALPLNKVSIHAPREGCDANLASGMFLSNGFNSRTPGGVRLSIDIRCSIHLPFQFTHPGRGATNQAALQRMREQFQFTHPGRGATSYILHTEEHNRVSIHAPREGCDTTGLSSHLQSFQFQFTHPGRGATIVVDFLVSKQAVSIHAPREGCDSF